MFFENSFFIMNKFNIMVANTVVTIGINANLLNLIQINKLKCGKVITY